MSVLFIALPVALIIATLAVILFVIQVRSGQYDDLDTPPRRMLFDDDEVSQSDKSRRD
jgi:cbb3-type cytochrome oxidase maturation protein